MRTVPAEAKPRVNDLVQRPQTNCWCWCWCWCWWRLWNWGIGNNCRNDWFLLILPTLQILFCFLMDVNGADGVKTLITQVRGAWSPTNWPYTQDMIIYLLFCQLLRLTVMCWGVQTHVIQSLRCKNYRGYWEPRQRVLNVLFFVCLLVPEERFLHVCKANLLP